MPLRSLLDNPGVVSYLEALGGQADRAPGPSSNRTADADFHAGIVALDDGLLDEETFGDPQFDAPAVSAPTLPSGAPAAGLEAALAEARARAREGLLAGGTRENRWAHTAPEHVASHQPATISPLAILALLTGMTLLGASAAALVFQTQISQILGW